jgi:hypothetical protein
VKTLTISAKEISVLLKKSGIIFTRPYTGLMIPDLGELLGIKNGNGFFFSEILNEIRKNSNALEVVSIGGVNALVTKEFFTNYLSLLLERSSKNGVYKQLPIKKYTKFERDLYEAMLEHGPISRKSLIFLFGLTGKKSRKMLDDSLLKLWKRLWITLVSYQKDEGAIWQAVVDWDKVSIKKALKADEESALEKIVLAIVRSSKVITRPQIRKLLKLIASSDAIDKSITNLIVKNAIDVSPKIIINGKKGLVFNKMW